MKTYVVYDNRVCWREVYPLETGITSKEQWLEQEVLRKDTNGKEMTVRLEFEAETREEAMQKYNDHYGYGKYIPME